MIPNEKGRGIARALGSRPSIAIIRSAILPEQVDSSLLPYHDEG